MNQISHMKWTWDFKGLVAYTTISYICFKMVGGHDSYFFQVLDDIKKGKIVLKIFGLHYSYYNLKSSLTQVNFGASVMELFTISN